MITIATAARRALVDLLCEMTERAEELEAKLAPEWWRHSALSHHDRTELSSLRQRIEKLEDAVRSMS